jgi:hypothetical protein
MDDKNNDKVSEYLDQTRWLINSGIIPPDVQNNLFAFGGIAHPDVSAVDLEINPHDYILNYTLYFKTKVLKKLNKEQELKAKYELGKMNIFQKLLYLYKVKNYINIENVLKDFVSDLVGPKWIAVVNLKDAYEYDPEPKTD